VCALRAHCVRGAREPVMIIAAELLLPLLFKSVHLPPDRRHQGAFLKPKDAGFVLARFNGPKVNGKIGVVYIYNGFWGPSHGE